jgi:G3E family GTPase
LQRLKFPAFPVEFPVKIARPGLYALFTQHHPDEFNAALHLGAEGLAPVWQHVFKPDHEHDEEVTSVGITTPGELDGDRLNEWVGTLLRTKGNDIFRMKGVLAVRGANRRLVFQGVHMLFDAKFDREWRPGEPRTNTLIFIGRHLDREALQAGFRACLA